MSTIKANNIMLKIHNTGQAVCGFYPFEVAETKILEVNNFAKKNGYPLKTIMKKI
jgi:ATP-dependent Clp protease adaptor protein ClpS